MSSQMDFESHSELVSSLSEGEMVENDNDFVADSSPNLHLGSQFCKICTVAIVDLSSNRECSECSVEVCCHCIHVYKLTSLGEKDTRPICNGCIPSIRKRILSKQQTNRMPQLVERKNSHSRHGSSVYCNRSKPVAPESTHLVVKDTSSTAVRSIKLMKAEYSAVDSLLLSFDGRPCSLTYNITHSCATRWFVGHTAGVTALSTVSTLPNTVATGSHDRSVKIWDTRVRRAGMTLKGHCGSISALNLVQFSNSTYCFTAGADEVIKVWDLRREIPLYELSTGNNQVNQLEWNAQTSSLVCASTCTSTSWDNNSTWPESAVHQPSHFPRKWNAGSHMVIQYDFTTCL
jgi:WD40 repeat protein